MRGIMLFRGDLRVSDNLALFNASHECRDGLIALFYLPAQTWQSHQMAPCKVDFILRHLETLKSALEDLNIPLIVVKVDTFKDSVAHLCDYVAKHEIDAVYLNRQYEWDECQRDRLICDRMEAAGVQVKLFDDTCLCPPGTILTPKQKPYTMFTPFKKSFMSWLSRHGRMHPVKLPEKQVEMAVKSSAVPKSLSGFKNTLPADLWPVGEAHALERLEHFIDFHLASYAHDRDYPALQGTSQLSAYLNIGAISPRMCLHKALSAAHIQAKEGVDAWITELVWREFYQHIVFHFPHVCKGQSFHSKYDALEWDHNKKLQKAWMEGLTGFPLVDAAMRQLKETGWMHNRLRMLVAMFFTKLMYQDWRIGESFFMQHLIDGAFAANNGGWQWCASTGTDAAPYFRIFNPMRQSENFDPEGAFIKQYCPELASLSAKEIHDPWSVCPEKVKALGYPEPIIDYKTMRDKTITLFKNAAGVKLARHPYA
jgi:deoxyribodipyrimidine photo-lyase